MTPVPGRRLLTASAAIVAASSLLPACNGGSGGELTIYSGRTENLIAPLLDRYAQETGVDIAVLYGDSADLALQLDAEGDRSPADVFVSQSPGAMGFLDVDERLLELPDSVLSRVSARFRADDGDWVGLSGRVRVIVYNTDLVSASELPDSVFDLTGTQYEGQVAIAPTNGSFQDFVTAMRGLVGDDDALAWLTAMRENGARTYKNNTAIVEAVARGEVRFGLVNHYYNERQKAEDPNSPTANHFLGGNDPGALILTTTVGVLDTAGEERENAQGLIEFLLSQESQEYFAAETFEYPLAAGVEPAIDLPPLADIPSPEVDLSTLGGGLQRTRELIRDSGLERS